MDEPTLSEEGGIRYLHFDSPWVQGAMQVRHPNRLFLTYTQLMMGWLLYAQPDSDDRLTQLGLGAGSLTRFCYRHFDCPQTVVERSGGVIQICLQYFRLPVHERIELVCADAQDWVADPANHASSRILMVDLYDALAEGPVCDSLEFYENCARVLPEDGILTVNLFGEHDSYERNLLRIDEAFDGQFLLLPMTPEGNQIVLAFKSGIPGLSIDELLLRAQVIERQYRLPANRWVRGLRKMVPA
ncbi:spermidine synthase [Orrella sp. 11846]|uniref:spermidine synthase n=1 Tax=Orrella sp. 11846 TaxID=3409913 RepID=UPI003B598408